MNYSWIFEAWIYYAHGILETFQRSTSCSTGYPMEDLDWEGSLPPALTIAKRTELLFSWSIHGRPPLLVDELLVKMVFSIVGGRPLTGTKNYEDQGFRIVGKLDSYTMFLSVKVVASWCMKEHNHLPQSSNKYDYHIGSSQLHITTASQPGVLNLESF